MMMIRRRRSFVSNIRVESKRQPVMKLFRATLMSAWILLAVTSAQELSFTVNDDVCGCSSAAYTFLLDFGLTCPPANIRTGTGSGVSRVSCLISPFGAPTTKLNPISIDSVSVLELDQSNNVLVEERIGGGFNDGDSFSYQSIINRDVTTIQNIPKALQLNLSGRNEDGVMLMNVFVITFTNECGVTPVLEVGESAGWVRFAEMSGPIPKFCPTREPSSTPSEAPSPAPSDAPSSTPSSTPSEAPTKTPTQQPSSSPTQEPTTFKPTTLPTVEPSLVVLPTQVPVANTTVQPTTLPTTTPIFGMPTSEPTRCPTEPPTPQQATKNPTSRPTQATIPPSLFETMSMSMSLTKSLGMNSFDANDYSELEVDLIKEFLNDSP